MITELPTPTQAERLAAAAEITATARHEIEQHEALAATVHRLKAAAVAGELDDAGAADLVAKAERVRVGGITAPRRARILDDALAAEVAVALDVLAELGRALEPIQSEAAAAADKLTAALVHPDAAAIRGDTTAGYERDRGRCMVEAYMPGVFPAAMLADRIRTASQTTWGSSHIPAQASEIVATFDRELVAIRKGTAALRAALRALEKAFG
jgi:hypothetical protein